MLIDAYAHALPRRYADEVLARLGDRPDAARWREAQALCDLDARIALLDAFGVDRQILAPNQPSPDDLFDPPTAAAMARFANDAMAELVREFDGRFLGVAALSLLDPASAAQELRRAVDELGLVGAQVYSNVRGRPIDRPEYEVLWSTAEQLGVPLWLHPARGERRADYVDEDRSLYRMHMVFGWPYDTTLAMARLVLGGVMTRHPGLTVIVHHAGAMLPFLAGRVEKVYRTFGQRLPDGSEVIDGFRRFYADTCTWGSVAALNAAYVFFGPDHLVLGSDVPYGADDGRDFLSATIRALEELPIPEDEKARIRSGNILRLLGRR